MFTREDYRNYFQEILSKERDMIHHLQALLTMTHDAELTPVLLQMFRDETRHHAYVKASLELIKEIADEKSKSYDAVKRFLDSLMADHPEDHRRFPRENLLGQVNVRDTEGGQEFSARCLDISLQGIGLELAHRLVQGRRYELWIDLYDRPGLINRFGTLMWIKEIDAESFVCGLEFE